MTADTPRKDRFRQTFGKGQDGAMPQSPMLLPLILLTALSVLPVNVILPSLPNIALEFKADLSLMGLSVAGYACVTAIVEIVAGAISDRYGRRPVALTAIVVFIVASVGCALATNVVAFLAFRALQASIAACFSIALVMIRETSREKTATSRFGYLAMGWALAPMMAPLVGGSLDAAFGWRAIFVALAATGTAVFCMSLLTLRETSTTDARAHDYGAAYRQLLRSRRFWSFALCMACSMGTLYVFLAGAPVAVGNLLGGSTATLGLCMGIVPAGFMLGSFLTGRFAALVSLGTLLIVARLLTCTGLSIGLGLALMDANHVLALFGPCIFIGIGNGLTMPAANAGALSVHPELAGTAAGLAAAISIGGGALFVSVGSSFLGGPHAIPTFFAVMLVPAGMALLAALCAVFFETRG